MNQIIQPSPIDDAELLIQLARFFILAEREDPAMVEFLCKGNGIAHQDEFRQKVMEKAKGAQFYDLIDGQNRTGKKTAALSRMLGAFVSQKEGYEIGQAVERALRDGTVPPGQPLRRTVLGYLRIFHEIGPTDFTQIQRSIEKMLADHAG